MDDERVRVLIADDHPLVVGGLREAVLAAAPGAEIAVAHDFDSMAAALEAVGFHTTDTLAAALAGELTEHARHVELQDSERSELEAAGQPIYELPMIAEGIDLAALYRLAAELRDQGAA